MYPDQRSRSAALFERARSVLPGGNSRHSIALAPYPIYAAEGEGCRLRDVDGAQYIDCIQNMSANIHGHRHPAILDAVATQLGKLVSTGLPTEVDIEFAELMTARVASVEKIRFANSGTEALMFAVRAARAFTGRQKVAKIEGGYHGSYDVLDVSNRPSPDAWGPPEAPVTVCESEGLGKGAVADTLVLPVNRPNETRAILERHGADLAAVVIDPLVSRMGFLSLTPEYLTLVRELTTRLGAVLIFDEVFSFRLGPQGAQGLVGVRPDLSAFGKIIGGGFPIGAVGGRAEVMEVFSHLPKGRPRVEHSGTFNANPVSMAAGLTAMKLLDHAAFAHLDALGEQLRGGLAAICAELGLPAQVQGRGSLFAMLPHQAAITDYRSFARALAASTFPGRWTDVHQHLINAGVLAIRPAAFTLCTPMTSDDIGAILEAARSALAATARGSLAA